MNCARINLSHGKHAQHAEVIAHVRRASEELDRPIAVLADLQGPKIRLGTFPAGPVTLTPGEPFTITTDDVHGTALKCSTTYKGLPGDVDAGDAILIDDGRVRLS